MKKMWNFAFVVALSALIASASAASEVPANIVKNTTDQVIARIKNDRDALRKDPAKMFGLVSELIFPHFDFPVMAQLVLGSHWQEADEASRNAFIVHFRKLLVRTYATALLEFSDQAITYPEPESTATGRTTVVHQEIEQTGSEPVELGYRLHNTPGTWKVFDVSVDGVSLVKTYRASFASMIKDDGISGLIASLAAKNKEINQ
jgi:phospholipid transport system substrate-binding protein